MKKTTQKKLSAFIMAAMMFSAYANAQIIYTDVNPDSTSNESYKLDFNNDGIPDFLIAHTTSGGGGSPFKGGPYHISDYIKISPKNGSKCSAESYASGVVISSSLSYSAAAKQTMAGRVFYWGSGPFLYGSWYNAVNGYLALKLVASGNTYYGWARLNTSGASSFTIQDYAYNSIPNQPILAGEINCAIPSVNLTQNGPLSFCAGDSVTFTANGTGYQYQWKKNNVNIAGATSQTYIAKTAGVYKCKVTNSCGSKTSTGKTVTVPCRMTNENFVETLEHLSVFPNPATNSVTIKFPSDNDENAEPAEVQIVNLFGQIVETYNYTSLRDATLQIDVTKLSKGMYAVRWSSGENMQITKFSVMH